MNAIYSLDTLANSLIALSFIAVFIIGCIAVNSNVRTN